MATANFYTFSKRKNSTLQPTGSGTQIDVNLKSGTSLLSPTFLLNISGRPTYNYVSFEGRYYFITDIISVRNDLWEIQCTVDALASWKSDIGSTSAMILYATGGSNDIIDTRLNTKATPIISHNQQSITGFTLDPNIVGSVILSITGTGSFGTYLMQDGNELKDLMRNVSLYTAASITDLVTGLQQNTSNGSIGQNLKGVIVLPLAYTPGGSANALYLGEYPCTNASNQPIMAYNLSGNYILNGHADLNIPWHFTDWRNNSPYTSIYLYVPLIGMLTLPTNDLINDTSIRVLYAINTTSGDVSIYVKANQSGKIIATASGNCAMSSPYGQASISGAKVGGAIVTGASGIMGALALSNPVTAAAALGAGLAASAGQMLNAWQGETSGGGGLGGGASHGLDNVCHIYTVCHDTSDTPSNINSILGKPVMASHTIGTYSGFVQTDGLEVSGNMTDSERSMINGAFNGGAYYE